MNKNYNKQEIVLDFILHEQNEVSIIDIMKETELNRTEVYRAVDGLRHRSLIKVKREMVKIGYRTPPKGTIKMIIRESQLPRTLTILNRKKQK